MIDLKTPLFWRATIALGLASFLIFSNLYYPQPLLPLFSSKFDISPVTSSMLISLALLSLGCSFFIYSAISDRYGRKNVLMITMSVGTVATFAIAAAPNFEMILVFRVIQAVAFAGVPTAAMAYFSEEFIGRAITMAVGIYISANSLGGMGGRLMSGVLTDLFNWRIAFVIIGVISLLLVITVYVALPVSRHFEAKPLAFKTLMADQKHLLKDRTMRYAYLIGGFHFFVFIGVFNFITYLLSDPPFSVSTSVLGMLFITYLAGTVSSTLAGKASQKWPQTRCLYAGIIMMAVSLVVTLIPSFPIIFGALLLLSFGFFFAHSTSSSWVTRHATYAKASANGLYLTSYYLGGSLGSFYYGWLWNLFQWPGVIGGSLVILAFTFFCTYQLNHIEQQEEQVLSHT
ncbi:MFS transporter [Thalassobacillus sp. CUG 92003]|uniref:MFS transporter n=1 Tax=Thalassobacillus sp. CUG 92003 TaxID=2736641 RepID=UPI0015E6C1BA|nr:MFS transporter [Thalassobacillus sp. CUG 92003]